jgi:hypothetical protein
MCYNRSCIKSQQFTLFALIYIRMINQLSIRLWVGMVIFWVTVSPTSAAEMFTPRIEAFFQTYCADCHSGGAEEGGFSLTELKLNIDDAAVFGMWEKLYDRVESGRMPPVDAETPPTNERTDFLAELKKPLSAIHAATKSTQMRRLNRQEYQNTLNDIFGIHLKLAKMLPTDGRSGEFNNVGSALSVSMVQLDRYMQAAEVVLDTAIAKRVSKPTVELITADYISGRDAKTFLGKSWLKAADGSVVFFYDTSWPSGMLREATNGKQAGFYKIRVTGYAYQSKYPITFSIGATSYTRGSESPLYGYFTFQPNKPTTIEIEVWMEPRYMVEVKSYGIYDSNFLIKRDGIANYKGPGIAISSVELEGPIVREFPSKGHQLIYANLDRSEIQPANPADKTRKYYTPQFEVTAQNETVDVQQTLLSLGQRLFRRPIKPEEIVLFYSLYRQQRETGDSIDRALKTAISAMLCSPKFLFFHETAGSLNAHSLANRLSYFLNRTAPDAELVELANGGELLQPAILKSQTLRLLNSQMSERFYQDFCDAWLNLRDIDFTMPDKMLFPEYDRYLRQSMVQETVSFLKWLLSENLSVSNLVDSDFVMINDRLAEHYGIPGVVGSKIRAVPVPQGNDRGGILAQAAILKVSANGTNTSPVLRGVYVLDRILGVRPEAPPAEVAGVEPDIRGTTTLRELLAKHREIESCNSCHQRIDPPGFAMECFDPIGGLRSHFRSLGEGQKVMRVVREFKVRYKQGLPVDASGTFESGESFEGFRDFKKLLATDKERLAEAFVRKLLTFATGREMGFSDRDEVRSIVEQSRSSDFGMRDLLVLCIQSRIFLEK